jgi:DNA-binding response OmpR family regulator
MSHILVIDNDASANVALTSLLSHAGYDVTGIDTALQGLRLLEYKAFDAVITEIVMPDMDGLEMIMALRAAKRSIPVVAMTGVGKRLGADVCLKTALALGADRIALKPVGAAAIAAILGGLLRR